MLNFPNVHQLHLQKNEARVKLRDKIVVYGAVPRAKIHRNVKTAAPT
jgi:hypothetical protein